VTARGSVGMTGMTELFFESAEPSFQDLPLNELLARFREGPYTFNGTTVDGKNLSGKATLKHNIPAGPKVISPANGESLSPNLPVVVGREPVTAPLPATTLTVTIAGYQVIVGRGDPLPEIAFSVQLPARCTEVTGAPLLSL